MFIFAFPMKKFASIFLLFIISIQCLPVKELGKCIFEQSFVEDDVCNSVEKKVIKDFSKEFFSSDYNVEPTFSKVNVYHFASINLYKSPFADLSIQPPNT